MRQGGGGHMQGFQAKVHAGGDDTADIGTVDINHIKGGGGAKIDHDQIATMAGKSGMGVDQSVGADGDALVDAGWGRQAAFGFAHDQRAAIEVAVAQDA